MGVVYGGQALFDSGPHRLIVGRRGRLIIGPFGLGGNDPFSYDAGQELEPRVMVVGRLVASTSVALWSFYNAIRTQAESTSRSTLAWQGQTWTDMGLINFEAAEPMSIAREYSLAYEVTFLKLAI